MLISLRQGIDCYKQEGIEFSVKASVGGASQLGFIHTAHEFLQLDGERHVPFDLQLPRHERQRRLHLP